jgi:hypothetical protein
MLLLVFLNVRRTDPKERRRTNQEEENAADAASTKHTEDVTQKINGNK